MKMTSPSSGIASLVLGRDHGDAGDSRRLAPPEPNWSGMHLSRPACERVQGPRAMGLPDPGRRFVAVAAGGVPLRACHQL